MSGGGGGADGSLCVCHYEAERPLAARSRLLEEALAGLRLREVVEGEFAEVGGGEVVEGQVAEGETVEGEDLAALAGEHAADLVEASLGEHEFGCMGIQDTKRGGEAGFFFAGEKQGAGGEEVGEAGGELAIDGGAVMFGDLVFWGGEAVDERGLIGEQEEAGGVFIETADAGDLGIARAPAGREEAVNIGAFALVVGADEAGGFVKKEEKAVGMVERLAVDEDVGSVGLGAGIVGDFSADGNAAGVDPVARFTAGAVAEVGEELIEAAHGLGTVASSG